MSICSFAVYFLYLTIFVCSSVYLMPSALSLSRYPWTQSIQFTVFGYIHFQGWLLLITDYYWLSHISQMFLGSICDGWRFHQVDLGMSNTRSSTLRFVMETLIFMTSSFSPFKHINKISPIQKFQVGSLTSSQVWEPGYSAQDGR